MTGATGSLAFRGPGIEDSMRGVTTNPSPSQAAGGESWSSRQALSVNLFSNSLIPLTKFPEPFCSLILRKAHNRIMPQSSRQLDPAQPRTACAAKHWSTMPPSLPSPFPVRKIPHPPPALCHIFAFSPHHPIASLQTNHLPIRKKYPPPFGKFAVFHKKPAYFRSVVFHFSSPSPGPDSARSTMPYS